QVEDLATRLRVRPPTASMVPGIGSPLLWCLGRPKLLWPAEGMELLKPDSIRGVIAHELAHLRRRDHWVGWITLLAGCVWRWNPLFWFIRGRLYVCAELACDAWVVGTLPEVRRAYAEALIEVLQLLVRKATPVPALGMGSG